MRKKTKPPEPWRPRAGELVFWPRKLSGQPARVTQSLLADCFRVAWWCEYGEDRQTAEAIVPLAELQPCRDARRNDDAPYAAMFRGML